MRYSSARFLFLGFTQFVLIGLSTTAFSQSQVWTTHTSLRAVVDLTASEDAVWAATQGGVFRYGVDAGEISRFTTTEGLYGLSLRAIQYDAVNRAIWVGYQDGVLDRIDVETGAIRSFLDIKRATQFTARDIRKLAVTNDTLVVGAGFGIVLFDTRRGEVLETFSRFGDSAADVRLEDFAITTAPDGVRRLWIVTEELVAYAPLANANLQDPSVWQTETVGAGTAILKSIAGFDGRLYIGTEDGLFIRDDANLYRLLDDTEGETHSLFLQNDVLIGIQPSRFLVVEGGDVVHGAASGGFQGLAALTQGPSGDLWIGDGGEGLSAVAPFTASTFAPTFTRERFFPDGPFDGQFTSLSFDQDGNLWLGGIPGTDRGFYKLDTEGEWTSYIKRFFPEMVGRPTSFQVIHNDTQQQFWAGSNGGGLAQVTQNGELTFFDETNSTLREASILPGSGFVIVRGVSSEPDGSLWVTNTGATRPLHVRLLDGSWTDFPSVAGTANTYDHIYVDSFGQKWIVAVSSNNFQNRVGLLVLDSGASVSDVTDDASRFFSETGSNGQGLPSVVINSITEDKSGRVWLGTDEGLAYFVNTGIVAADENATAIWPLRSNRQAGESQFLFFGLKVNHVTVDPANNLWVATDAGAWYVEEQDLGFQDVLHLTAENSPLLSNIVLSIAVDERTGAVYFSTDLGLISLEGDAVAPAADKKDLFVYPNPVRIEGDADPEITIEGLLDETDVRILTPAGSLVAQFDARGGRVRWNGRDTNNNLVPSGMYIVVALDQNGEGAAYGKVAVIR